jgi:magnesium transporter
MQGKKFPPDTAGGKIITSFPRALLGETIGNVERMLIEKAKTFDTLDYVYVVDADNMLHGVVSVKEILGNARKEAKVEEVMKRDLVVVHPLTKQERIVYRAILHNIKAVPVVDEKRCLLGIVPYDTILRIFNEEVHEDVFKFGGIFHKVGKEFTTVQSPASVMIKRRLPWLVVGVLGGAVTASIVSGFEDVLSTLISLAAFAPVLAYLSDAVGTQSETLAVRSMALDPKVSLRGYIIREIKVAVSLALICGLLIAVVALVGWRNKLLGVIVGASMFLSILAAVFISTFLPFLFRKLDLDPAIASGPFATMVSDVATIAIYFSVASALMSQAGLLG